ncbi:hypothetical protein ACLOJK_002700 [Asimina triloba]
MAYNYNADIDCPDLLAEAMADAAVNILFQNLNTFLIQEASLLGGARSNFEDIKKELDSMRSFLRDADRRKDDNEGLRTWVGQVRDATYNVEDIIDEFTYRTNVVQRGEFTSYILQVIRLPEIIFRRHQLATRLQDLKCQIATISGRKDQYQLSRIEDGSPLYTATEKWQHRDGTALFMHSSQIVGLAKKINELVKWLKWDDPRRAIIAVVGMGGLGKTTLVAQTYKNGIVKKHFDCSVWVSVSQSYSVEELLQSIIKDLFQENKVEPPSDLKSMNRRQLLKIVHEQLTMKRYFIILDDVWRLEAWRELNVAFPQNSHGSRIIITTRNVNVASGLGDASCVYPLKPLQGNEAWNLFGKNAFWKEPCPKELEPLAQSILKKCQGLPLAIVSMGSLLSLREKTVPEWDRVLNNLSRQLSHNSELEPIKHILLLSFYDLPYNLKHCFLYCCIFPEDYLIYRKRLIRLWVAEGFVEDEGGITMEEVAEDYLKELVHRNMLQVVKTNHFGRFKSFRVHDIVREVALSVSQEEKFCMIYNGQQLSGHEEFRRMSIYNIGENAQLQMNLSSMRSLLVFDKTLSFLSSFNMMSSSFRLIRVLHLEGVPIKSLPDEVANLFNLRYLSLRGTEVTELPKSLGKMQNLQTLDLINTKLEMLPSGIVKLRKLRHLFCLRLIDSEYKSFHFWESFKFPPQLCQITSLQSLQIIEADGEIVRSIGNLTQLRSLCIAKVRADNGAELCASISKMKHLATLAIVANSEEETLELEALSTSPPPLLQKLLLQGHLEKVPQWLCSLANLTQLQLFWSRVREEERHGLLLMLQALPNLKFLSLREAYDGQQLCFQDGWFPKLKTMRLWDFTQLRRVVIEKGAMPSLRDLRLDSCRELKMLPEGIEHMVKLHQLLLKEMPSEFVERLRARDGNNERQKVAHIPIIQSQWKIGNELKFERLS